MKRGSWTTLTVALLLTCILGIGVTVSAAETTTIRFFHTFWVPEMLEILGEAINRYQVENDGVIVRETRVSWTDASSQLMMSIMGGESPDLIVANPSMVAQFRSIGAFAEIGDLMPEELTQSFSSAALDMMTNPEGKIDGIANEGCTWGLFYRSDLFEEAGLNPNSPPETWEELVEFGQKLTKDTSGDGRIDQWGYGWPVQAENATDYWEHFMWSAGSEVVSYENGEWLSHLTEEPAVTGTQFMVDLIHKYKISPFGLVDMNWEDVTNGFVQGNFAMMHNGAWVVGSVAQKGPDIEGQWGTAPIFAGPAGRVNRGHPNTFHILKASDKREQTWDFVEFLYTEGRKPELSYMEEIAESGAALIWTDHYIDYARRTYPELALPFVDSHVTSQIPPLDPRWETLTVMFGDAAIQELLMTNGDVKEMLKMLEARLNRL